MQKLEDNIWKNYLLIFFQGWWFTLPIYQLYFIDENLLSFTQMGSLESGAGILFFILTIPGGAFSDLVSRKWSVFLGSLFTGGSMLMIGLSSDYHAFFIAYLIWSLGDVFLGNARSALMYDSVKQLGKEEQFIKISGRGNLIGVFSLLISGILGPLLFKININLPWVLMGSLWLISTVIITTMVEPKKQAENYSLKNYLNKIKDGFKFSFKEKHVLWVIFFVLTMDVSIGIFNELISQRYFLDIGFQQTDFIWIFPLVYGLASLVASQSHHIKKFLGETGSFIFILVMHSCGLLVMGLIRSPYILIITVIMYISRDFRWIFANDYINKHSVSNIRATILSIMGMIIALVMSFTFILGGMLVDNENIGVFYTLVIVGSFAFICSIILLIIKPKNS
jgi:MFS family permease